MGHYQIVGIMLIKDEDLYIERVLRNVLDFCDQIIIAENYSQDRTYAIVNGLAQQNSHIKLHRIHHVKESHTLIEDFADSQTWIFAIDGDEIYDPVGLARMRQQLLNGELDHQWVIFGNVLHCTKLDLLHKRATGYLAPPSRSMTKLFNFALIQSWTNGIHRLHCGELVFKNGYHAGLRCYLGETVSWEKSDFRCLHTVFLKRSSLQRMFLLNSRWNPSEAVQKRENFIRTFTRVIGPKGRGAQRIAGMLWKMKLLFRQDWKNQQYKKGKLVEVDISAFLPE